MAVRERFTPNESKDRDPAMPTYGKKEQKLKNAPSITYNTIASVHIFIIKFRGMTRYLH